MPIFNNEYGHRDGGTKNPRDGDALLGTRKYTVESLSVQQKVPTYRGRDTIQHYHIEALTNLGKVVTMGNRHTLAEANVERDRLAAEYGVA